MMHPRDAPSVSEQDIEREGAAAGGGASQGRAFHLGTRRLITMDTCMCASMTRFNTFNHIIPHREGAPRWTSMLPRVIW